MADGYIQVAPDGTGKKVDNSSLTVGGTGVYRQRVEVYGPGDSATVPVTATVVDGGDVALGATTDAAVATDTTGTLSGKIRGLVKILASMWDSANNQIKATLRDSSGNAFDSVAWGSDHYMGVASIQDAHFSAGNSSTANLAANATFTGTRDSSLASAGIQFTLVCDQPCRVYVDQSGDDVNYDVTDTYLYNPTRSLGLTVQCVGSSFRLRVTNIGASTTTTFRLISGLLPMVEALPRSLDTYGNLKVGVNALADQYGFNGQFEPIHTLQTSQPLRLVGSVFGASIDTTFWTATNVGVGASAGVASAIGSVTSGVAASASAVMTSVRSARFIFAHPLKWRGAIRLPSVVVANNTRGWGAVSLSGTTPQNGPYFSVNGAGVLSVNWASNGTPQSVASGSFNGDVSQYVLDTNVHAYEIIYFTMGIWFYIDNVLIHRVTPTTSVLQQVTTLPINFWSVNDGTGGNSGVVECWNTVIMRLGRDITAPVSSYIPGATAGSVLKVGAGCVHRVLISTSTNTSSLTLYDNTAASGTIVYSLATTAAQTGSPYSIDLGGLQFYTGLTVVIVGASMRTTILYE